MIVMVEVVVVRMVLVLGMVMTAMTVGMMVDW